MNVKTIIVGQGVADTMVKCIEMVVDPNFAVTSGIRKVGMFGRYPVWLDPLFDDDKVMITYRADSGDDAPCKSMVESWKDQLDTGDWILLSDSPKGRLDRANNTTPSGRTQRAP